MGDIFLSIMPSISRFAILEPCSVMVTQTR